ncbi:MAG: hypothetical protein CL853_02975 [Crocinitomicaceae bacterium]|nr:hypothetical protein [Crocinitomicaceae bacterium]|tara:strand:+ start:1356 stop:1553 length:198 start_codon:yes stop_codon:yes gene_type:complete
MKKMIIPALTCFFMLSISSCKKCQTCSITVLGATNTQEVCEENFNSKEEYEDWISAYESTGGECQ